MQTDSGAVNKIAGFFGMKNFSRLLLALGDDAAWVVQIVHSIQFGDVVAKNIASPRSA